MQTIHEGDFTVNVPIIKDDEIGDLAKSFNIKSSLPMDLEKLFHMFGESPRD